MSANEELEEWYNVFLKQYKSIVNQDIKDWTKIEELVRFFVQSKLECLVDYIDSSWLDAKSLIFESKQKLIRIVHNEISQDLPQEELELQLSVFGAHRTCSDFFVDCVRIVPVNEFPVLLIKSRYNNQEIVKHWYCVKCEKIIKIRKGRIFCSEIFRLCVEKRKKIVERIILPNVNCFTAALFPKYFSHVITEMDSKRNLLRVNEDKFDEFFRCATSKLQELANNAANVEDIKDFGNRIRRNFENYLKVRRIRNNHYLQNNEKDCQKLMLGDLVSELTVKELPPNYMKIGDLVQKLNDCSHDSGIDVSIEDLLKVLLSLFYLFNEERMILIEQELKEKGIIEDKEEREKKELLKKKYDERKKFIINNACLWDLKQILQKNRIRRNLKYYFCLKENVTSLFGENAPRFYLSNKGRMVQYSGDCMDKDIPLDDCFSIYDRTAALKFAICLKNKINDFLKERDFDTLGGMGYDVSVNFVMHKKARRLFSKKEVDRVIQNADDLVDNRLVIDEYGHLCVVQVNQDFYPVCFEYWPKNCGFFGKLASEKHLAEVYSLALSGYLSYLKTGISEFVDFDYVGGTNEEKIMRIRELIEPKFFQIVKSIFYWVLKLLRLKRHDNN